MLIITLVLIIGGFHSILLHGQRLVVNFTHVAALCDVEASKFHQIIHTCNQTQGQYL